MKKKFEDKQCLLDYLSLNKISLSDDQIRQIVRYCDHLLLWNQSINLTAHHEIKDIIEKDLIDSLKFISYLDRSSETLTFADIGCGAGFIGILLKIVSPKSKVLFIDKSRKRINFVRSVVRDLKLEGVKSIVESLNKEGKPEDIRFDIAMTRGTWSLRPYIEHVINYLNQDGLIYMMAGKKDLEEEVLDLKSIKVEKIDYEILPSAYKRKVYKVDKNSDVSRET